MILNNLGSRSAEKISVVVGATGMIKPNLENYLNNIPGSPKFQEIQKSAVWGTVPIAKRTLGHESR